MSHDKRRCNRFDIMSVCVSVCVTTLLAQQTDMQTLRWSSRVFKVVKIAISSCDLSEYYVCPHHGDNDIHTNHSSLDILGIPLNSTLKSESSGGACRSKIFYGYFQWDLHQHYIAMNSTSSQLFPCTYCPVT